MKERQNKRGRPEQCSIASSGVQARTVGSNVRTVELAVPTAVGDGFVTTSVMTRLTHTMLASKKIER